MDEDRIVDVVVIIGILGIIIAKLAGWITWPWIWLTAIIWIPFVAGLAIAIGFLLIMIIEYIIEKQKEKIK